MLAPESCLLLAARGDFNNYFDSICRHRYDWLRGNASSLAVSSRWSREEKHTDAAGPVDYRVAAAQRREPNAFGRAASPRRVSAGLFAQDVSPARARARDRPGVPDVVRGICGASPLATWR